MVPRVWFLFRLRGRNREGARRRSRAGGSARYCVRHLHGGAGHRGARGERDLRPVVERVRHRGRVRSGRGARAPRDGVAVYNRTLTMVRILVTNDDGYRSEGIHALAKALKSLGAVTIVAPIEEASAIGHALTLRHPLRLEHVGEAVYAVDGTPTDCVNVAVTQVFRGLPDLVVSGINKGWNLGDD